MITRFRHTLVTSLAAVTLAAAAHGITINSAYLLGTVLSPVNANPDTELAAINLLVQRYNSGLLDAVTIGSTTYDVQAGANIPAPLLPMAAGISGSQVDLNFVTGTVNLGTDNAFLVMKASSKLGVYYISGLNGSHTLTNDVFYGRRNPKDISHFAMFAAVPPPPPPPPVRVPDQGATLALFGLASAMLIAFRRRFVRA